MRQHAHAAQEPRTGVLDTEAALARWLRQIQRDTLPPATSRTLAGLVHDTSYPRLYWSMFRLGQVVREDSVAYWHRRYGVRTVPDCTGPVPYSAHKLLEGAAITLGITLVGATPLLQRYSLPEEVYNRERPVFSWLRMFAAHRSHEQHTNPLLILDEARHVPVEVVEFDAAAVLGVYKRDEEALRTYPGDYSLYLPQPQVDRLLTPLAHAFARGFLALPDCTTARLSPPEYRCCCAAIREQLSAVPSAHPEPTGPLDQARYMPTPLPMTQRLSNPPQPQPQPQRGDEGWQYTGRLDPATLQWNSAAHSPQSGRPPLRVVESQPGADGQAGALISDECGDAPDTPTERIVSRTLPIGYGTAAPSSRSLPRQPQVQRPHVQQARQTRG